MSEIVGYGRIKRVMGITGSQRPCSLGTCGGHMRAFIHSYDNGKSRLVWSCEKCHIEHVAEVTEAVTREVKWA
jgi:Zn-finger protein